MEKTWWQGWKICMGPTIRAPLTKDDLLPQPNVQFSRHRNKRSVPILAPSFKVTNEILGGRLITFNSSLGKEQWFISTESNSINFISCMQNPLFSTTIHLTLFDLPTWNTALHHLRPRDPL